MADLAIMDEAVERRGWRQRLMRPGPWAALVLAAAGAMALLAMPGRGGDLRIARGSVQLASAEMGVFRDITTIQGTAVPLGTIVLDAQEGGRVEQVFARPGDHLTKGQPIVQFSNTELELEILSQEGRLIESVTQLQAYQRQLERERGDNARAEAEIAYDRTRVARAYQRRQPLAQQGFIRREEMDQLSDELASIDRLRAIQSAKSGRDEALRRGQLPQIEQQLAALKASLAITRSKLGALIVRAPADGQLSGGEMVPGENRKAGERLGEIILGQGFRIRALVDEFYLGRVRLGQIATMGTTAGEARLTIERINPHVEQGRFAIDLAFAGPQPGGITAGQALRGTLSLGQDGRALVLPAGAFLAESGGTWAFVLDADGKTARRRAIRIGRRSSQQVEVLEGIKPGERVIISSYDGWRDVQQIELED